MSLECRYPDGRPTQSTTEEIAYKVDCTEWSDTPTSPAVDFVFDETDGTNVKATVMPSGSPTVSNTIITCPLLKLLTLGRRYRVECHFTGDNSSREEFHFRVFCDSVSSS